MCEKSESREHRQSLCTADTECTERTTAKGLLVVSFGTTHAETRHRTIDAIEAELAETFPDRRLYRGWTSGFIVKRLRGQEAAWSKDAVKAEGETDAAPACRAVITETVEEALQRIQADGIRDLLVQPTHLMAGKENDRMLAALREAADGFDRIAVGQPLLGGAADLQQLAQVLADQLLPTSQADPPDALVLMGHGSAEKPEANRVYEDLQEAFRRLGQEKIVVATVEGTPTLEDILHELGHTKSGGASHEASAGSVVSGARTTDGEKTGGTRFGKVVLAPLMIVAGDHARNDMTGPAPDSWANRLRVAGYDVTPVLRGLGEYAGVRAMFAEHAARATTLK